jgi:hypothetical protein
MTHPTATPRAVSASERALAQAAPVAQAASVASAASPTTRGLAGRTRRAVR